MCCDTEVSGLLNDGTDDRPADIYFTQNGIGTCLDVSVVGYEQEDGLKKCEVKKNRNYFERCRQQNLMFKPLLMTTLGSFSEKFIAFIAQVSGSLALVRGEKVYKVKREVIACLQVALLKSMSCFIYECIGAFEKAHN